MELQKMKRSDMVKVIEKAMRCWNGAYFNQSLESHILEYIEEAGMLPPKTNFKGTDGIVYKASVWDNEDEK